MDITVDPGAFGRALRLVGRAVPARPVQPVLLSVLLEADGDRLRLTATDLDIAISTAVPAAGIEATGRAAVPARLLGEFVAELPAEPLRLTLDATKHRLRAACGRFAATLAGVDPADFPAPPSEEGAAAFELPAAALKRAIGRVAFAAARDEQRPVLTAVLFDLGTEALTLAAADGFRLARARMPAAAEAVRQLLVPARAVVELGRVLGDEGAARLSAVPGGRGVRLAWGATTVFARLVEGSFPDVGRVVPREAATRVQVAADGFRRAIRVAGLFGEGGDARPVMLDAAEGRLRLHARGQGTGETDAELPATLEGEPQVVVLSTRLLAEVLEAAGAERIELAWSSPSAPVLVRDAAATGPAADLWVVMPLFDEALTKQRAAAHAA